VVVHTPVPVPAALTVVCFVAPVEESLVTSIASPVRVQELEPKVTEPELPMVEGEWSLSAEGAVTRHHLCHVRWVEDEASVASQKAKVVEVMVSLFPALVPAGHSVLSVASGAREGGSDCHARNQGTITVCDW